VTILRLSAKTKHRAKLVGFAGLILLLAALRFYWVRDGSSLDEILTLSGTIFLLAVLVRGYYRSRIENSFW